MARAERKGIKNYTTQISVERTISEIEKLLAKHGAKKILKDYDDDGVSALSFMIQIDSGYIPIKIPVRADRVVQMLNKEYNKGSIAKKFKDNIEQARRIMWRIILDWLDAQMTMIEVGQRELIEVFFADILDLKTNKTLYEQVSNNLSSYLIEFKG
jgi:tRNA nucleotidyltransferase/poly(A) polymerase